MSNRVIKDSIWTSPTLAKLPNYIQDQWPRWLLMADDWGCFNADPQIIKGLIYPKRNESINKIIKIKNAFKEAGLLFIWNNSEREWGLFVSWNNHQFCNASGVNNDGKYTKHRRKTPIPPQSLLDKYSDKFQQIPTKSLNPNPNPNPKPNLNLKPNIYIQIKEIWDFYLRTFNEIYKPRMFSDERKRKVKTRLKEYSVNEIKEALINMRKDEFLCGKNDSGIIYANPEYCFRNDKIIEKWLTKNLKPGKKIYKPGDDINWED